jgi:hypothetical protein
MAALAIAPLPAPVEVLAPAPVRTPVLYDLEQHLACLLDTEEMVPTELEEEYSRELQATLTTTIEKRDRVGQFILHLKSQIALAHAEGQRLRERETFFEKVLTRMEGYVTWTIDSLGLDAKGKRKKLEGKTVTLFLHGCDKRAEVLDEAAVPTKYKRITVTLPAETWELVCESVDLDLRQRVLDELKSPKIEVNLSAVKADLKAEVLVPGAQLAGGTYVEIK